MVPAGICGACLHVNTPLQFALQFINEFDVVLRIDADFYPKRINRLCNIIGVVYIFCNQITNWIFERHYLIQGFVAYPDRRTQNRSVYDKTTHCLK